MTMKVKLNALARSENNGKAKTIRNDGYIPAVVYGSKTKNKNLKIKNLDFIKAFEQAGEFNLIDLIIDDGEATKVIVKEVQKDHIKNKVIHVDFYQVDMSKKIIAQIPLNFVGESNAVKNLGATLVKNMDSIEVSCLPGDLVSHIDVDLSTLNILEDLIRLHDLKLPAGIELASETNEAVAGVTETKVEEEPVKPAEEVATAEEAKETKETIAGEKVDAATADKK